MIEKAASDPGAVAPPEHAVAVAVEVLPHAEGLPLPAYATPGSAAMDLAAAVLEPFTLASGARALVPTGLRVAIPLGFEGQLRPRSGIALRHGVTLANAPGTIDSDYRGELQVLLVNLGSESFTVTRGMRIAQLLIAPVVRARWVRTTALDATARGGGGFGHTGT